MAKKKELGKGIRALLGNIEKNEAGENPIRKSVEFSNTIPISNIEVNPSQPRKHFDQEALEELAESIKIHGLIQPLTVRRIGGNKYQLIAGERRFRASKLADLNEVPVYIREVNDQELLEMALVENIQRADLNAIEVAISYQRLIEECDLTHDALAERVGKKRSTISNYTRLLKLPPPVQTAIKDNLISMGHARCLAGIEDQGEVLVAFNHLMTKKLSVRALEQWIKNKNETPSGTNIKVHNALAPELRKLRDQLSHKYGSRVHIRQNAKGKGELSFSFGNTDELNDLLDQFLDD